jgi:acyl-CoA thioester hydrolase
MAQVGAEGPSPAVGGWSFATPLPWRRSMPLRVRDLDYLGHVTELAHVGIIEESRFAFMQEAMGVARPIYVVASHQLTFRKELLLEDGPVTVSIGVSRVGRRSVDVIELVETASGGPTTESEATLVAWEIGTRRPRPFTTAEHQDLSRFLPQLP